MPRGNTNRNHNGLFMPTLFMLFTFVGTALFMYFYIFQVASLFSLNRFLFSFACSGAVQGIIFGILIYKKKVTQAFEQIKLPHLLLQALIITLYFIFFIPLPTNHLFSKSITLQAEFQTDASINTPVEILWINNGLRDISYSDLDYPAGEIIENTGLHLFTNNRGIAALNWHGTAWKALTIVARSNAPFTADIDINGDHTTYTYHPETNQDFRMNIPIQTTFIQILAVFLVLLSSFITISFLLFVFQLLLRMKLFANQKISVNQTLWIFALALPLLAILLYLIRIGLYNRLYSDDYCYRIMLLRSNFFQTVIDTYLRMNGRYMSHIANFLLVLFDDKLMPFGMLITVTSFCGSLTFLFYQILNIQKSLTKLLVAFIYSSVGLLTTLTLVPDLYESSFWALHTLSIVGGIIFFNIALGLVIHLGKRKDQIPFIYYGVYFLFGVMSCGFHENVAMLIIFSSVMIFILSFLFTSSELNLPSMRKQLLVFILGTFAGFIALVFSPGEHSRLAAYNVSYVIHQIPGSTVDLLLVKRNVLFQSYQWMGITLFALANLFVYILSRIFSNKEHSLKFVGNQKLLIFLLIIPFIPFFISFAPSTLISNYYPNRTLIVPIYFFTFLSMLSVFLIATCKNKTNTEQGVNKVAALILILLMSGIFISRFYPYEKQFEQFSAEWEYRDALIRQAIEDGDPELKLSPYEHSFGIDISTTNNLFLTQCYDEYYGIHIIPPQ